MSEYFTGVPTEPDDAGLPPRTVEPAAHSTLAGAGAVPPPAWVHGPEHVRFGLPFNGVVPVWHDGTEITWHRPLDGTDFSTLLGLGHVETEAGPSPVPAGWHELVETGTLVAPPAVTGTEASDGVGLLLVLHPASPAGRRATAAAGEGARIPLSPALTVQEAMGDTAADFDITGFSVHIGRLMLRAAAEGAILLLTLRAPRDPEAHHLLSAPSSVDEDGVMHFHLGTLLEVDTGAWAHAQHADGMALLDLDVPYASLLASSPSGRTSPQGDDADAPARPGEAAAAVAEQEPASAAERADVPAALSTEALIDMAQPVIDAILSPGFPFALGASFIVPAR